jgi:Tfp pilus assembly protein PilN
MAGRNGTRIGIALSDREVVGVILGRRDAPGARVGLTLGEESPELGSELRRAFRELRSGLEQAAGRSTAGAPVHLAVLPPLADARLVSFPPMRKAEVEAVLGRDVARYFVGAKRPRVVGIRLPHGEGTASGRKEQGSLPVLAAAAPLGLLEAARSALEKNGWRCVSISAGQGAWVGAALTPKGAPPKAVISVVGGTAHVLSLDGRDLSAVRQIPITDLPALTEAVGGGPGRVMVLASPQMFEAVSAALSSRGLTASRDPEGWPDAEEGTAGRAGAADLELIPPTLARERKEKGRRNALALAGAAVVLVLASFGAQLWGAYRELGSVQARRASIRSEVAPLISARDSLNGLSTQIQSMEELSRSSPVWTRSLVELAALLPEDTYLTGFFASGDTVELEAAGAQAGEAIQTLREAGLFQEVRLQGLVERELEDGETVVERFKLWARVPPAGGEGGES